MVIGLNGVHDLLIMSMISHSNWTEWSKIRGIIARVISKSEERETRGRFEYSLNCTTQGPVTI